MTKQPFFMRFVEKPVSVETAVKAGAEDDDKKKKKKKNPFDKGWECMKYPSDADESLDW